VLNEAAGSRNESAPWSTETVRARLSKREREARQPPAPQCALAFVWVYGQSMLSAAMLADGTKGHSS